ncbi:MAG: phenylalanine--tRNA ligase subunit beta, partial [Methylophilales bacterium]|nr:phenylalanine--tRNA ligase subunit beta [Methylophilales bacterium]
APASSMRMLPAPESIRSLGDLRQTLVAADYFEAITYSFVDAAWEQNLANNPNPIMLRNPIASNMSVMRSSLMGGLLDALSYNLNRNHARVRLFEIGACFSNINGYTQRTKLAGLCYGSAAPEQWGEASRHVDFYDLKADVEKLVGAGVRFATAEHPALHPGQCASVWLGGKQIGILGTLHPRWQQHYDLPQSALLFELDVAALTTQLVPTFTEVPKFPAIRRDLAVVVDEVVSVQSMLDAMLKTANTVVSELALFDIYRGAGIGQGKKSLAFLVLMQDTQKTLTDQEADSAMQGLLKTLTEQFGATLRS